MQMQGELKNNKNLKKRNKMKKGKFLTFTLIERDEQISGIVLDKTSEWILIKRCTDYLLDGYTIFENNDDISFEYGEHERLATVILKKKGYNYKNDIILPNGDITEMFNLLTEKYTLLALDTKKGDAFDVVKFIEKKDNLFLFRELTVNAKWRSFLKLPRKSISVIHFDNDYLNSLKLLLK